MAQVAFSRHHLEEKFYCEGANTGDFDRDGHPDLVAGPWWYAGPEFTRRTAIHPPVEYDPHGYSENFLTFAGDFNGDGWDDVLYVPWPGKDAVWYENPAGADREWRSHRALTNVGNESPAWTDLDGDGRPELVYNIDGFLGYATWDPALPDQPWSFHPISERREGYQRYTHGLGVGDLNGDGKPDVIESAGWWQQPESLDAKEWIWHPFPFAEAGAQILVADLDGDGKQDVMTSWHAHRYGLLWYRQTAAANGEPDFEKHTILSPEPDPAAEPDAFRISQMHALALADINCDGLPDIVTGKRFWAHGPDGDVEPAAPAVLVWFELTRTGEGRVSFRHHLIDVDSGVGTQVVAAELNGDQRPDIIVGNKKGTFLFLSQPPAGQSTPAQDPGNR